LAELIHRVAVEKRTFRVTDDYAACAEAGRRLQPGALVIIESTVAPGTTQHVLQPILERESGLRAGALWRRCSAP